MTNMKSRREEDLAEQNQDCLIILDTNMTRDSIDSYDKLPDDMITYLSNYGMHFNKKLNDFAVVMMNKKDASSGQLKKITPFSKEDVDRILSMYSVSLENNQMYDYVYVANMIKADFLNRSISDDRHMATHIKCVIDDDDVYDGIVFNRWYADMRRKGIAIDWEEML